MCKGLEALEDLYEYTSPYINVENIDEGHANTCYQVVRKNLTALEIIKNKEINVHALFIHLKRFADPSGYNVLVGAKYQILQEEYDLLKEVLL